MTGTAQIQGALGLAFRKHAAELTAQLSRRLGAKRLDLAEDMVQQALVQALRTWSIQGVPADPRAWLARVSQNALRDQLRREGVRLHEQSGTAASHDEAEDEGAPRFARELDDDMLRLLFACCHPLLSEEMQLALTLKVACGFSVGEIAHAFLCEEPTIAQRIVRAKRILRDSGGRLDVPAAAELSHRASSVLKVVYLLFNAGYEPSSGEHALREELDEALRLVELLATHPLTRSHEVHVLAALLYLVAARMPARVSLSGELVVLEQQDRARWDTSLLSRGFQHLAQSMGANRTRYHLEAGIAAAHALSPSVVATDWEHVLQLYDALLEVAPSPVVALNRAVALGEAGRSVEALAALGAVEAGGHLSGKAVLVAARAHLLERSGRVIEAAKLFAEAARLATTQPQRNLFLRRAEACCPKQGRA